MQQWGEVRVFLSCSLVSPSSMAAALIGNWEYYFLPLPLRVLNLPTLANLWVPHHLLLVPLIPPTPLQVVPSLKISPQLDTVSPGTLNHTYLSPT